MNAQNQSFQKAVYFFLTAACLFSLSFPLYSEDAFLIPNSEEIAEKLDRVTSFTVRDMPLNKALGKLSRENKIQISLTEEIKNPEITIKAENMTVRDILRQISRITGYEMMAGFISVSVIGPQDFAELQERQRILALSMEGGERRDKEIEKIVKEFLENTQQRREYFIMRLLVALNRPDRVIELMFRDINDQDKQKKLKRYKAVGRILEVNRHLEKQGMIEDRYYLTDKKYVIEINKSALKQAREKAVTALHDLLSREIDPDLCLAALMSLGQIKTETSLALLRKSLDNPDLRFLAAHVLVLAGDSSVKDILKKGLSSQEVLEIICSAEGLLVIDDHSGYQAVRDLLDKKDLDKDKRKRVILLLSAFQNKKSVPALIEELKGPWPNEALGALENIMRKRSRQTYDLSTDLELVEKAYIMWKKIWQDYQRSQKSKKN